jgi:hypothetical protein
VVRVDSKLPPFQQVAEVADTGVYSKQFPVKSRVFLLCRVQLLGKESQQPAQGGTRLLLL